MEIYDMISLDEVYEITGGSEELFRQMADLFIEISPMQLERINAAYEAGNYSGLRESAHDMKSSASSLAAKPLYNSSLELEEAAKNNLELNHILPMIKDVEEKVERTIVYFGLCSWPDVE